MILEVKEDFSFAQIIDKKQIPKLKETILHIEESNNLDLPETTQIALRHAVRRLKIYGEYQNLTKRINIILNKTRKYQTNHVQEVSFKEITYGLRETQIDAFGETIELVQTNIGCPNIECNSTCNYTALKFIRKRLSFEAIEEITDRFSKSLKENETLFYHADDPLAWKDNKGRNYLDIQNRIYKTCGYYPEITTAIPKGTKELAKELWKSKSLVRISMGCFNENRITKKEVESWGEPGNKSSKRIVQLPPNFLSKNPPPIHILFAEHGTKNIGIRYKFGILYDYKKINSHSISTTDGGLITPEGLWSILETDTTPLSPNGYLRFKITKDTNYFIKPLQVAIPLRPLEVINKAKKDQLLPYLVDYQIYSSIIYVAFGSYEASKIGHELYNPQPSKLKPKDLKTKDTLYYLSLFKEFLINNPSIKEHIIEDKESDNSKTLYEKNQNKILNYMHLRTKATYNNLIQLSRIKPKNRLGILNCQSLQLLTNILIQDPKSKFIEKILKTEKLPYLTQIEKEISKYQRNNQ